MRPSSLFDCTLSTNEADKAVKVFILKVLLKHDFPIYPYNVWIHQSRGLTKFSKRQQDEPTSLTLQEHRKTPKMLKNQQGLFLGT
jgi:hypothetical protein